MVQYILTPWRDRQELLLVRRQFYAYPSWNEDHLKHHHESNQDDGSIGISTGDGDVVVRDGLEQQRRRRTHHQAVAQVSMWVQRGNCPHMVESTALLTAAVLTDEEQMSSVLGIGGACGGGGANAAASSAYTVRAAYSAAFSRFVTGLLDGQQDKLRKQSMFSLAKTIGLPATFVELRHQSTHEQLPSLAKLRSAAKKALVWIWGYYWKGLDDDDLMSDDCQQELVRFLRCTALEDTQQLETGVGLAELRRRWRHERLLLDLDALSRSLPGQMQQLRCMSLLSILKKLGPPTEADKVVGEEGSYQTSYEPLFAHGIETESESKLTEDSDSDMGWSAYQGQWKPKPIGMV